MTEFNKGHHNKCHICGERYFEPEGKACVCWKCNGCGEEFTDLADCANKELYLCMYCEDERRSEEIHES